MKIQNLTPEQRISKARITLNRNNPFFGYITMHLNPIKDNEYFLKSKMPTMGVNKYGDLYYSSSFIEKQKDEDLLVILAHESIHVALLHMDRLNFRQMDIFNIATDLVVNTLLLNNNFKKVNGCLYPDSDDNFYFNEKEIVTSVSTKCAEQIYAEIIQKCPKLTLQLLIKKHKNGSFDNHLQEEKDNGNSNKLNKKDLDKNMKKLSESYSKVNKDVDWKQILAEATQYSKNKGNEPKGIGLQLDKLLYPKVNWKVLLRKYIIQECANDYTWAKPNKRSLPIGYYFPSLKKDNINLMVAIDTSGSISKKELTIFISELIGILKSNDNIKAKVYTHDYIIQNEIEVNNKNYKKLLSLEIKGGGGTSHKQILSKCIKEKPKLLICFTDLYSDLDEIKTGQNTLFVTINDNKAPFGKTIKIDAIGETDE